MSTGLSVRDATVEDIPIIRDLVNELIEVTEEEESLQWNLVLENWKAMIGDNQCHILLGLREGQVAGLVSFSTRRSLIHEGFCGLIDELIVKGEYRGGGIGQFLLNAVVDRARKLGCCELEVSTEVTNDKARSFYRANGFDEEAVLLEKHLE